MSTLTSLRNSRAYAAERGSLSARQQETRSTMRHAMRAEYLAGRFSVAPPVPSKLADFDERAGVNPAHRRELVRTGPAVL